jgi:hypothetical protein
MLKQYTPGAYNVTTAEARVDKVMALARATRTSRLKISAAKTLNNNSTQSGSGESRRLRIFLMGKEANEHDGSKYIQRDDLATRRIPKLVFEKRARRENGSEFMAKDAKRPKSCKAKSIAVKPALMAEVAEMLRLEEEEEHSPRLTRGSSL